MSLQVLLLLRQLTVPQNGEAGDSGLAERLHIQNQELEKMEILRKELDDKTEELDKLKSMLAAKEQELNKVQLCMAVIHLYKRMILYVVVISLSHRTKVIIGKKLHIEI